MSWVLAFLGFVVLIVLHEAGHFAAAKAVGMRVEKFSLFFGKPLVKTQRGETEYAIGWIPLGGYVRITGMDPREELPADVQPRAYYAQKVWKRIVVIAAGPAVNIVLAFLIIFLVYAAIGMPKVAPVVGGVQKDGPAAGVLQVNDKILSVDGVPGFTPNLSYADASKSLPALRDQISTHTCSGTPTQGCVASTAAKVVVERDGQQKTFEIAPRTMELPPDPKTGVKEMRPLLGITYGIDFFTVPLGTAVRETPSYIWYVMSSTAKAIVKIFYDADARKDISSVAGAYDTTRQTIEISPTQALIILAVVSLSLAIINLAPFLPLDGGHIFWALAEKVRGRPIPFAWLERASMVGFVLVMLLFALGLTNDIGRWTDGTAGVR